MIFKPNVIMANGDPATQASFRRTAIIFGALTAALGAVALAVSIEPHFLIPHFVWKNEVTHSAMEGFGASIAVAVALILLSGGYEKRKENLFPVAMGFLAMGILDAFHAAVLPGHGFVLFHSASVLVGGFWFALIWLPIGSIPAVTRRWIVFFMVACACVFGIWTMLFRETMPLMVQNGKFTLCAAVFNFAGGILFLASALRIVIDAAYFNKKGLFLFAFVAFLLGIAGITFHLSALWDLKWWFWHFLRFAAFIITLGFVVGRFQKILLTLTNTVAALRKSEERFRSTLDNMMEGCQIIGFDWRYLYINEAAAGHGRRAREDFVGRSMTEAYPGIEATEMFAALRRCMEGRRREHMQNEFVYPDGGAAWFELVIQPVPEGIFILSMDITERKRAEDRIAHLNRVLRAIRDVNQLIVREKDPDKLIRETCGLLVEHRGYESALIILEGEDGALRAGAEKGLGDDFRRIEEYLNEGKLPACCEKAKTHGGIYHTGISAESCAPCPLADSRGNCEAMCVQLRRGEKSYGYLIVSVEKSVGLDAEEKSLFAEVAGDVAFALNGIEMEADMRRARKERDRIESELRQSQKMEAVGRLAGGIAHDFNNMLTVINNYAEFVLAALGPDDPLRSDIEQILNAGRRSADLTRQLLAFSRRQVLAPEIININQIVENIEPMIRRLIGEDIALVTHLSRDLGKVKADPAQIEQVLMNLVINSRDAMPAGGKLTLETGNVAVDENYASRHPEFTPGDYAMLSVTDTGCGMDEATAERIFDPFFTTKETGKGTGLGLSTVHGIVRQSGGHIWVYSEPGRGTTFKIHLPRAVSAGAKAPEKKKAESRGGTETILVVEDERGVCDIMKRVLSAEGYTVLTASNGGEALLICERGGDAISLLLTDVVMPEMSGRELAGRLEKICPRMKVLYMSGYTENAIVHHGVLDEGINFISKPFSVAALREKVRAVLDG